MSTTLRNALTLPQSAEIRPQFLEPPSVTGNGCRVLQRGCHYGWWFWLITVALWYNSSALAVDGVALEIGTGDESSLRAGAAVQWNWDRRWFSENEWYLGGYWEVSGSYWKSDRDCCDDDDLFEVGATPVFRMQSDRTWGRISPFIEAGVGGHLLSQTRLAEKQFSTAFQFASHIGTGIRFGNKRQFELLYRFQHLSNASIKQPNDGINFHVLRLGYWM